MTLGHRVAVALVVLLALARGTHAGSPEDAILPLDHYKSDKARALAAAYAAQLTQIYDNVYHCLPWLQIGKHGLGFRRPRGIDRDNHYLSIWVWVDQISNPEFAAMPPARRASAMFSRYGVDLLRRLSRHAPFASEPRAAGYAVVLSWLKPDGVVRPTAPAVAETLAVFADTATVDGFLALTVTPAQLADRALVASFDGKSELGRLALEIWDDPFTATFKLKDYTPDPAHRCEGRPG
ncbi:MAG: hypothetical protein HY726_19705 [Candidatus Rokubacteria bacterium]|nr:hypothetical protein [Candidatus Rokubacteria bacterium]